MARDIGRNKCCYVLRAGWICLAAQDTGLGTEYHQVSQSHMVLMLWYMVWEMIRGTTPPLHCPALICDGAEAMNHVALTCLQPPLYFNYLFFTLPKTPFHHANLITVLIRLKPFRNNRLIIWSLYDLPSPTSTFCLMSPCTFPLWSCTAAILCY